MALHRKLIIRTLRLIQFRLCSLGMVVWVVHDKPLASGSGIQFLIRRDKNNW